MQKYFIAILISSVLLYGLYLFLYIEREVAVVPSATLSDTVSSGPEFHETTTVRNIEESSSLVKNKVLDIENQQPLAAPPEIIKLKTDLNILMS